MLKNEIEQLKAKTYYLYKEKTLYRKKRYFLMDKLRIECIGGDNMGEEKQLVFIKPDEVPRLFRGSAGRDWEKLYDKIPKGEVLVMDVEIYGSAPNIRTQVKIYNKTHKNAELKVTQRTDKETEKVTVYVQRVK